MSRMHGRLEKTEYIPIAVYRGCLSQLIRYAEPILYRAEVQLVRPSTVQCID